MFHCPCAVESREPCASSPAQTEIISRSAPAKAPGLLRKKRLSHTGLSHQRRANNHYKKPSFHCQPNLPNWWPNVVKYSSHCPQLGTTTVKSFMQPCKGRVCKPLQSMLLLGAGKSSSQAFMVKPWASHGQRPLLLLLLLLRKKASIRKIDGCTTNKKSLHRSQLGTRLPHCPVPSGGEQSVALPSRSLSK